MITSFSDFDPELTLTGVTKRDIIASLTLDDVKNFLESLGVTQIEMYPEKGYLICPTICHNPIGEECSMKLYWYHNHKIFKCYTECDESMSIFRLYQKYMALNEHAVSLEEAEDYVKHCLKHIILSTPTIRKVDNLDLNKYQINNTIPQLDEYSPEILSYFTEYHHPLWLKDGILPEVMDKFNIRFSLGQNKIIIPHYDINGRLIGIRGRTIDKKEAEEYGKYRPIQIGKTIYSHPLQFNLYGIYEHQNGIRKRKSAIIVEGEKSVLLDDGFYGEYSNAVACCGSTFNKYHIKLLTDMLGAEEIIVALDKEYSNIYSDKARKYRTKIEEMCKRYSNQASFSYIWDYTNLLEEKDSPYDKGKTIFEELYKNRERIW